MNNYSFYEERTKSYASRRHRIKSYVLFTYGFNIKRKHIKEKKEVSIRSIDPLKLIKRV